jgi:thiol:disulfide interchange protein DsbD
MSVLFINNICSSELNLSTAFDAGIKNTPISLSVDKKDGDLLLLFNIEEGSYLYKNKIEVYINNIKEKLNIVEGESKVDLFYGETIVIYDSLFIGIKRENIKEVIVKYQGCSEEDQVCYLPQKKEFKYGSLSIEKKEIKKKVKKDAVNLLDINFGEISKDISKNSLLLNIFVFLMLGIVVSLTPCVLPMIPIISSILIKDKEKTVKRSFMISLFYVIGVSLSYCVVGILIATTSFNVQAYMQNTVVLYMVSFLFLIFALILSDKMTIRLPIINTLSNKINTVLEKIAGNSLFSIFLIGFVSSLILSPCVAIPLTTISLYIGYSKDLVTGAISLFSFGFGTGFILIIFSASLSRFSIKSGVFMLEVKLFLSYLLIVLSLFILARIIGFVLFDILFFTLTVVYSVLLFNRTDKKTLKIISVILTIIVSAYSLPDFYKVKSENLYITSIEEVDELAIKKEKTLIKITADWCIYCQNMERETFSNLNFLSKIKPTNIRTIDLTEVSDFEQKILNKYGLIAPPSLILLYNNKAFISSGYMSKDEILEFTNMN